MTGSTYLAACARRRHARLALLAACSLMLTAAGAAPRPIDIDALMRLDNLVDIEVSPNGRELLYLLSQSDPAEPNYRVTLHRLTVDGSKSRRVSTGDIELTIAAGPRWSPDGEHVGFTAQLEGSTQVFALSASDGTVEQVSAADGSVISFQWSPDSNGLYYVLASSAGAAAEATVERVPADEIQARRLWYQELGSREQTALSPPEHFVSSFDVSRDGHNVVYSASLSTDYMSMFDSGLFVIDVGGDEFGTELLVPVGGMNSQPKWSPDGKRIAYITSAENPTIMSTLSLATVSAATGEVRDLTRHTEQYVGEFAWDATGETLLFTANPGKLLPRSSMFETQLYSTDMSGEVRALTSGAQVVSKLSTSSGGDIVAYKIANATSMGNIFVRSGDAQQRKVTRLNAVSENLEWGDMQAVSWDAEDGTEIWGLLRLPPDYLSEKNGPIPLITYIHGGPIGTFKYGVFPQFTYGQAQGSPYPVYAWANEGVAVFLPNPRGGHGYGEDGFRSISDGRLGQLDYADIMSGIDMLIAKGVADEERLGVAGGSYGGYMTFWIVTQTSRFRAASAWAGVSDMVDFYVFSDAGDAFIPYLGGRPWDINSLHRQRSAINYTTNVTTPILIQHGGVDQRVPTDQARKFFKYLTDQGKHACMEIYANAGHVSSTPADQETIMQHNLAWFRYWLLEADADSKGGYCPW